VSRRMRAAKEITPHEELVSHDIVLGTPGE
jgi:hypothetical protein